MLTTVAFKANFKITKDPEVVKGKKESFIKVSGNYVRSFFTNNGEQKTFNTSLQLLAFKKNAENLYKNYKAGDEIYVEALPKTHEVGGKLYTNLVINSISTSKTGKKDNKEMEILNKYRDKSPKQEDLNLNDDQDGLPF